LGRFGNQADHFLGSLGFAKGLNKTLVLPPWVEYRYGELRSVQVPFDKYFKVESLEKFHRVMTMEKFMKEIAPEVWPPENRKAFCYMARGGSSGCNAKDGNPFGPFWDTFNIDFVGSELYGPLHYDIHHTDIAVKWAEKYPPEKWPVLAFTGAPASFPVQKENKDLQRYLSWSDNVATEADTFVKSTLPRGAYVGIHLRNGVDWVRACEHIKSSPSLFAAPQCLGYMNENGIATEDMCLPSAAIIMKQLKRLLRHTKDVKSIVVASDNNHMIKELTEAFKRMEISVHKANGSSVHVELAILGRANHFIGNCISSFTAFVKRARDVRGLPSEFWAFPPPPPVVASKMHEEL
ncbi:hypothetical protein AAG570_001332, partial [Ranatra chinensis]